MLAGTDYVYPRTTNKILEAYLKAKGVAAEDIMINYTPFGHSDWQTIVADIKKFGSAGKKTAVVSTINGDANVPFYKELGNQGIKADRHPGRRVLGRRGGAGRPRHHAAASAISPPGTTSSSVDTPENKAFIDEWHKFIKNDKRTTNDPMEAHYIGFNMWVKAVEKAGTTDPDAVIDAHDRRLRAEPHRAAISTMMPNHHITKPVLIGEIQADGQFETVCADAGPRRRRRVVGLPRRLQGPDLRLARAAVLRQLQRQDRQVRRHRRVAEPPTSARDSSAGDRALTPGLPSRPDARCPSRVDRCRDACVLSPRFDRRPAGFCVSLAGAACAADARRGVRQVRAPASFDEIEAGIPELARERRPACRAASRRARRRPPRLSPAGQGACSSRRAGGVTVDAGDRRGRGRASRRG